LSEGVVPSKGSAENFFFLCPRSGKQWKNPFKNQRTCSKNERSHHGMKEPTSRTEEPLGSENQRSRHGMKEPTSQTK
jgi:hypothetical protein